MHDGSLHALARAVATFPGVQRALAAGGDGAPLGLPDAVHALVVAAAGAHAGRPIVWLVPDADEARARHDALRALAAPGTPVHVFPAPDPLPYERIAWDPATREARIGALLALHRWRADPAAAPAPIVVAPMRGALTRTLPPARLAEDVRALAVGARADLGDVVRRLHRLGYERQARVTAPGEMAVRGGILDVFPPSEPNAVRLEWFGDEIESIRGFDPTTQRSIGALASVVLGPASEALPDGGPRAAERLGDLDLRRVHPVAEAELRRHVEHLARGERFAGIEAYASLMLEAPATLLDHLPPDAWVACESLAGTRLAAETVLGQADAVRGELVQSGELPEGWPARPLATWDDVEATCASHPRLELGRASAHEGSHATLAASFGAPPSYASRVEDALDDIGARLAAGAAVVVASRQAPRLAELLGDAGHAASAARTLSHVPGAGGLALVHEALGAGFVATTPGGPLVVLTDRELFGWRLPYRRKAERTAQESQRPDFFAELNEGDFVVHIEHGIGVFQGLLRMTVGGIERDYLHLVYAAGDTLYVPTHQSDRIARYVGAGEVSPAISRLGTADWERAKARAKREIEDIAADLLALYARRELARRNPFAPDGLWQAEMEAAFPYHETDDQMRAIDEVKRDMESGRPMDRLVVGDVGFGKTEVALRAAFKAVNNGRQVAVLAPTTVLTQQHYETFTRRLGAFPVRVESLSRFRKRAEQADIVAAVARGEVDVLIGTHRLLGQDVRFRDLGLLIVDEEHRFGVKHKERLREMAHGVDTLTLTATPIPRTMHLALTGLRDLTTIDTPPAERLPVATHVGPFDEALVRTAIRRELERRGQTFYVFNRVRGIEHVAQKVMRLVPEARVAVAHGQLGEAELAEAMLAFVGGEVDVLVCTSIIESGLDIPNANTLIVERADRFGLAQLHQLRGRVGRSPQRAYAYFLHPADVAPDEAARGRLEALADDSALGAGMRIALRDLELRGAGEILGARQHGHVAAIGLDLYTRLLAEAVKRVRADHEDAPPVPEAVERELATIDPGTLPTVDLPLDAYLPETYVTETRERTRMYRRMAAADDEAAVREIESELRDRFGRFPAPVRHLLIVLRLRVLAHLAGATSVAREGHVVAVRWPESRELDRPALIRALDKDAIVGRHRLAIPLEGPAERWLPRLQRMLQAAVDAQRATVDA